MTNKELKQKLTDIISLLNIPGIGRGRYQRLIKAFGSPAAALGASISRLEKVPGVSRALASEIRKQHDPERAGQMAARIIQLGWTALYEGHPEYPSRMLATADYPALWFRSGDA